MYTKKEEYTNILEKIIIFIFLLFLIKSGNYVSHSITVNSICT